MLSISDLLLRCICLIHKVTLALDTRRRERRSPRNIHFPKSKAPKKPTTYSPACVSEVNHHTLPLGNPEHTPIPSSYPSANQTQPGPPCSRAHVKALCTKS